MSQLSLAVVAKPNTITPHTNFKCEVYVLKKEEGGRHTPFFKGYRPQFYIRTMDITGALDLPEGYAAFAAAVGPRLVTPGDRAGRQGEASTGRDEHQLGMPGEAGPAQVVALPGGRVTRDDVVDGG